MRNPTPPYTPLPVTLEFLVRGAPQHSHSTRLAAPLLQLSPCTSPCSLLLLPSALP